jgi:hypothetical protein
LKKRTGWPRKLRLQWDTSFDRQRQQLNPQKVERITLEMARFLAEKAVHDTLAGVEKRRTDPTEQEWLLRCAADRVLSKTQTEGLIYRPKVSQRPLALARFC